MICSFDCFNCKFEDCINDELQYSDYKQSDAISEFLKIDRMTNEQIKRRAYKKDYYERHKDKIKAYSKDYYKQNKDRIKAYKKAYYEAYREKKRLQKALSLAI